MKLNRNFFNRNTVLVAQKLLGKVLVRKIPSTRSGQVAKIIRARIIETEAYCGAKDLACHASKGLTERTKVMFGPAGFSYVYMIYGMYHCLNIVTEKEGNPSAVLIRAVQLGRGPGRLYRGGHRAGTPVFGEGSIGRTKSVADNGISVAWMSADRTRPGCGGDRTPSRTTSVLNGPGKLCRELKIDRKLNAIDLAKNNLMWIEDCGIKIKKRQIKRGKRIGVDYAGKWKDKLWRFWID